MESELQKFWAEARAELTRANADRKHPFRNCVLATVNRDRINQRTVVHRKFIGGNTSFIFTDSRSKKVMQLEVNPLASLLFYDAKKKLQISVAGMIKIHEGDELANIEMEKLQNFSDYSNTPFPGTAIPKSDDYSTGDMNFMLLEFHWLEVDVLKLNTAGHKRALMRRNEENWNGTWIVP